MLKFLRKTWFIFEYNTKTSFANAQTIRRVIQGKRFTSESNVNADILALKRHGMSIDEFLLVAGDVAKRLCQETRISFVNYNFHLGWLTSEEVFKLKYTSTKMLSNIQLHADRLYGQMNIHSHLHINKARQISLFTSGVKKYVNT